MLLPTTKLSSDSISELQTARKDDHSESQSSDTLQSVSPPGLRVIERHVSTDYRSFAATLFGTVAFKMLEWLTPPSVGAMSREAFGLGDLPPINSRTEIGNVAPPVDGEPLKQRHTEPISTAADSISSARTQSNNASEDPISPTTVNRISSDGLKSRRNSRAAGALSPVFRDRKTSESMLLPQGSDEHRGAPKQSNISALHPEKRTRASKKTAAIISGGVPEIPNKPAFFENITSPQPPHFHSIKPGDREQSAERQTKSKGDAAGPELGHVFNKEPRSEPIQHRFEASTLLANLSPPQYLCRLDVDTVDFICRVFQEDLTSERPLDGPCDGFDSGPQPQNFHGRFVRRPLARTAMSKRGWQAFNEQTIFAVLSDPAALVNSFTKDGNLYDSHTIWYCMFRLIRVAPSLVLHSLWIAAESLFAPPQSLQALRSPVAKVLRKSQRSISNFEAGSIVSICLHALVAAAPFISDSRTLFEMSRIRATGRTHGSSGAAARQTPSICLAYDDVFSNDLALRLARRLFSAITARQAFAEIADSDRNIRDSGKDLDMLRPLLNQLLDLLGSGATRVLEFSQAERLLHETRVPTLILDWARAALLKEWNGEPEFPNDGPFSGAISLMAAMYESRNDLLLGDIQFRVDYFPERLDAIEMPVAWLSRNQSIQRRHILDYPFMFNPDILVSYFRSINFARMSRMFEESSSLKTRMGAIVEAGSLITNPHHKVVLQDLLRTASSKYLVLDIARDNVLRDAFDQLWRREERELLRPLKVHLGEEGGEEGFDSGGVQQEFFRMAVAECLDPSYGAFTIDDRTRMAWFVPGSVVETWKFELIGLLVSLAVYNGLTLPVTFPRALYSKLLGKPVKELHHIADGWPALASGLTALLEWDETDGLVEDIFARTYEFSVSTFDAAVSRSMINGISTWPSGLPGPDDSAASAAKEAPDAPFVTDDNRDEYVSDYIRYLTDVSVRPQFTAFERGFRTCLDQKSLSLLSPQMLQAVVEGIQDIDVSELRRYARYVGWDASHHTVKDFWAVVRKYDDRMRRKLLEFVTASDRVPVGGMRNLQFVVQKNGEEEGERGHLPTAYTCYGTLLLPEYKDKEVLRERLAMALENAQGFGFA